ncbi:hypothetical protein APS63_06800 [Cutibacterium acnes]|nr:hypothetical protein TIA1EST1_06390 [Cutibacterium acnes hdn-1]ALT42276.1 hypothetical protein ALW29_06425 [Cutibacterium acnes]KEY34356.1 biotin carboxylase [Cutibacterium acnes]OAX95000.1 hypothetical protein A9Y83_09225 [Cutibacterium acnes]OAY02287.1 hypothetical protein A9Y84_04355 [Cutibacterium acnes]
MKFSPYNFFLRRDPKFNMQISTLNSKRIYTALKLFFKFKFAGYTVQISWLDMTNFNEIFVGCFCCGCVDAYPSIYSNTLNRVLNTRDKLF